MYYASGSVYRVYTHVSSPRVCASKCAMHPTKCNFWIYSPPTRDDHASVSLGNFLDDDDYHCVEVYKFHRNVIGKHLLRAGTAS